MTTASTTAPPARPARRSPNGDGDAALMARVAAGEAAALAALYDRYARVVFAFAQRIVGDRGLAEEVLQEVFFRAWRRAEAYQAGRGEPITWLLSLTHNLAIDEIRKRNRRPRKAEGAEPALLLNGVAAGGPTVEEEASLGALRGELAAALAALPPAQREAVALAYFGGLSQREIAATVGAPLGTIKTRLRLGLDKLRVELEGAA